MKKIRGTRKSIRVQSTPAVRASISFPSDLYETLENLAKQKKVSLAWVVRDAAEKYLADGTIEAEGQNPPPRRPQESSKFGISPMAQRGVLPSRLLKNSWFTQSIC